MARIEPLTLSSVQPSVKVTLDRHMCEWPEGITNTKLTLGRSLQAFEVYIQLYPLYESVEKILGLRLACLYAIALTSASSGPLCVAYFRKKMADSGECSIEHALTDEERITIEFGKAIARHYGNISDRIYNNMAGLFSTQDIIVLIAFAGQLVAMSIFNNVTETEPDAYIRNYWPEGPML
ncbi:MAG: hypothetical protein JNM88_03240 [Chitinophagaceae bacterium]|nr:hypothetical protein [Chitinophagaceae bacterium]